MLVFLIDADLQNVYIIWRFRYILKNTTQKCRIGSTNQSTTNTVF